MMRLFQCTTYGLATVVCFLVASCTANDQKRNFIIFNESGCRVEINWINPDTNERVLQSSPFIYAGATFDLNSYITHRFEAKELPSTKTGDCKNGAEGPANPKVCGLAFFTVNENFDQVFYIREGLHIQHDDNHSLALTRASGLLKDCQKDTLLGSVAGVDDLGHREMVVDMARCIEDNLKIELEKSEEESGFQGGVRLDMAELLATYACADVKMKATEATKEETWRRKTVKILHDRAGSKVHILQNFVSKEECRAMEKGLPTFGGKTRATSSSSAALPTPNGDGVRILEEDIVVPWDKEAERNSVAAVSRRILAYTNHALGLDIDEHGQEGLTSVQYVSTPSHPNTPSVTNEQVVERYEPVDNTPHCGEKCRSKPHRVGQRIAAVVMYCGVPGKEGGGATNFHNLGTHHIPEKYSAMFFSYMNPKTFQMDTDGYTEHTDCPVLDGEKRIVKQWIRHGVHTDNPWDLFEHETAEITKIMEEDDEREL